MDFAQLRQFIEDSLRTVSEPDLNDGPISKKEFLALWEMLCRKLSASELAYMRAQQRRLDYLREEQKQIRLILNRRIASRLATKPGSEKPQGKLKVGGLRNQLKRLEEEITQFDARMHKQQKRQPRLQSATRVLKDIELAFKFETTLPTGRLPWRVLPPGKPSVDSIRRHYDELQQRNPQVRFDRERITKALSLHPNQYYVGEDEFKGYIVLTFAYTPKALMECPMFGNAIYIINSDWKRLSRVTKQELLENRSREVTRIVHRGNWFSRIKQELGIR